MGASEVTCDDDDEEGMVKEMEGADLYVDDDDVDTARDTGPPLLV